MSELISIIVPVYNIARDLPRCLDSILTQTYAPIEIIAVDDGSQDSSGRILDDYAARYPQLTVIHQKNCGVTSARLHGVSHSKGSWIGFVDGDDYVEPDMFQHLYKNAIQYDADISHCGYRMVFADGRVHYFHNTGQIMEQNPHKGLADLLDGSVVEPGLCNKLFRAQLFQDVEKDMDPSIRINEDLLMNFLLFRQARKSVFEDFCPYHYIVRQTSASRQKLNDYKLFDPIRVRQLIWRLAPPEIEDAAHKAYLNSCLDACNSILLHGRKRQEEAFQKVRSLLAAQWKHFPLMGTRRTWMARGVLALPCLYSIAWRIYVRRFQKHVYE